MSSNPDFDAVMIPRPIRGLFFVHPFVALEFRGDEWREIVADQSGNDRHGYGPWQKENIDAAWARVVMRNQKP